MKKYKINIITLEEWNEPRNTIYSGSFYPARYRYPRPFHRSYVAEPRFNPHTNNIEFLTENK